MLVSFVLAEIARGGVRLWAFIARPPNFLVLYLDVLCEMDFPDIRLGALHAPIPNVLVHTVDVAPDAGNGLGSPVALTTFDAPNLP